jgi:hypothetical protein
MNRKNNIPDQVKQKVLKKLLKAADLNLQELIDQEDMKSLEKQISQFQHGN